MTSPQAVFDALSSNEVRGNTLALDIPGESQGIQVPYKDAGEETLATARAKVLPDPLRYLILLSPAARTESDERRVRSVSTRERSRSLRRLADLVRMRDRGSPRSSVGRPTRGHSHASRLANRRSTLSQS